MSSKLIELVIAEATSRGLRVERIPSKSRRNPFDKRRLLIEGTPCQVVPSKRSNPSKEYPHAEYFPLYLPRSDWPDFLIYVSMVDGQPVFHIVPRIEMAKDTGLAPRSLTVYRGMWDLLHQGSSVDLGAKRFETLSWQLEIVSESAKHAGLEVQLIQRENYRKGGRWPPIIKRRIIIAGKKCALFSAVRLTQNPTKIQYNYALFRISKEAWPEFQLYVVENPPGSPFDVYVIPRHHLTKETTASLEHPELVRYKNAWSLVTASREMLSTVPPIQWREQTSPPPPTRHFLDLQETIRKAEDLGLLVEPAEGEVASPISVQSFIYISKKPCQVIQAKVLTMRPKEKNFQYLALNPPTSTWAEFLIFRSPQLGTVGGAKYYVVPRQELGKATSRSLESPWLKQFEEAWHLLR